MKNTTAKIRRALSANYGSQFRRNILKVTQANIIAQALPVLAAPLLTRLYAPDAFGAAALFAALLSIFLPISILRIDWLIPNAQDDDQAAALFLAGLWMLALTSLLTSLVAYNQPAYFAELWSGWPAIEPFFWLLPIALFVFGLQQLVQGWHIRSADLTTVSHAKILQGSAATATQTGLGFKLPGPTGLIIGHIAGLWASALIMLRQSGDLKGSIKKVDLYGLKSAIRAFATEACQSSAVSLINAMSLWSIPILLSQFHSTREIGWYALMHRLIIAPASLVTRAVSQSFWAEAATRIKSAPEQLRQFYKRCTYRLMLLSMPIGLGCITAPIYVGPILGETEWEGAGYVLAALTPMVLGQIIVSPLSHLIVHRKQQWQLGWDTLRLLFTIALIIVSGEAGFGLTFTVALLSFVWGLMYWIVYVLNLRAYEKPMAYS